MTDEIRSFASSQRLSGTREINLVTWSPSPVWKRTRPAYRSYQSFLLQRAACGVRLRGKDRTAAWGSLSASASVRVQDQASEVSISRSSPSATEQRTFIEGLSLYL